jgi:rRNA maturation endonuclease Nob1
MASYKQACIHCGTLVDRDARFCPQCGSISPFGYACPSCLRPVNKQQRVCAGCGRALYVTCPACAQPTFVQAQCERCGHTLMVKCQNRRCQTLQFFENTKCTACGKRLE